MRQEFSGSCLAIVRKAPSFPASRFIPTPFSATRRAFHDPSAIARGSSRPANRNFWLNSTHGRRRKPTGSDLGEVSIRRRCGASPAPKSRLSESCQSARRSRPASQAIRDLPRKAARKPQNHAIPCRTQHTTPASREITKGAVAHAAAKTVGTTTTNKTAVVVSANPTRTAAVKTAARKNSARKPHVRHTSTNR